MKTTNVATMNFEWDATKAATNLTKHGVSFETAARVFADPHRIESYDAPHSTSEEDRWLSIGMVNGELLLLVSFTLRGDDEETTRLISARKANEKERKQYRKTQP